MHARNGAGMTMADNMSKESGKPDGNSTVQLQQAATGTGAKRDYAVGYRKPPAKTRFQKGKSGNPKGRAKTEVVSDVAPLIESIFAESVKVREGETIRTMSNLEAMLHAQLGLALKGKPAAIRKIFELAVKASLFSKAKQKSFLELTEPSGEDGKIIRAYHAEMARQATATESAEPAARPMTPDEL